MKKHLIILSGIALLILGVTGLVYFVGKWQYDLGRSSMPGMHMVTDTGKRYTVSFLTAPKISPNQNTLLQFKVYDAGTGAPVSKFDSLYTQLIHLVIVNSNLDYFTHIHPTQEGSVFSITTQFPKADIYRLYINFQPQGEAEQQFGFSLSVGVAYDDSKTSNVPVDTSLTKTFGDYKISLKADDSQDFNAQSMAIGAQVMDFNLTDAKTGQGIKDLQPYLGAFGHLVMINEQTYQYIHIHPIASLNPNFGGPEVQFLPASLFTKITAGTYRVFAQFKQANQVFVADFTINVK